MSLYSKFYWSFWRILGIQLIILRQQYFSCLSDIQSISSGNRKDEVKFLCTEEWQLINPRITDHHSATLNKIMDLENVLDQSHYQWTLTSHTHKSQPDSRCRLTEVYITTYEVVWQKQNPRRTYRLKTFPTMAM